MTTLQLAQTLLKFVPLSHCHHTYHAIFQTALLVSPPVFGLYEHPIRQSNASTTRPGNPSGRRGRPRRTRLQRLRWLHLVGGKKRVHPDFNAGVRLNPKAPGLDQTLSAFVVFKSDTEDAQAEVYLPGEAKSRLFDKVADKGAGTWKNDTFLLTQWKGMYTLQGGKKQVLYEGAAAKADASK